MLRHSALILAVLILPAGVSVARPGAHDMAIPPIARGAQRDFIRGFTPHGPIIQQQIFDGERWLPLTSEDGWLLFITIQHEENPDALE